MTIKVFNFTFFMSMLILHPSKKEKTKIIRHVSNLNCILNYFYF